MHVHADKTKENKSQSVANGESQMQSRGESTFKFVDNKPEALASKKLQLMANNSPQVSQLRALQVIANNSPQSKQITQLQAIAEKPIARQQQPIQMIEAVEKKALFIQSDIHYVPSGWENDNDIRKTETYLSRKANSTRIKGKKFRGQPETRTEENTAYTLTVVGHGREGDAGRIRASWVGKMGTTNKTKSIGNLATKAAAIVNRELGQLNQLSLYV
ncbi:MAG: hypothetical protein ABJL44_13380 [Algibacter sp.]